MTAWLENLLKKIYTKVHILSQNIMGNGNVLHVFFLKALFFKHWGKSNIVTMNDVWMKMKANDLSKSQHSWSSDL